MLVLKRLVVFLLFVSLSNAVAADPIVRQLISIDEPALSCSLDSIGEDWSLVVQAGERQVSVDLASYVRWGVFVDQPGSTAVIARRWIANDRRYHAH